MAARHHKANLLIDAIRDAGYALANSSSTAEMAGSMAPEDAAIVRLEHQIAQLKFEKAITKLKQEYFS